MNKDLTTLFTGRNFTLLSETESTNTYLSSILRHEQLPEGTAVRALNQIAGRGQSGSKWESEAGKNLLISFVFYPNFIAPRHVFDLNKAFTVAVYDFVKHWLKSDVSIKWPNDIFRKRKKIAGILIENSMSNAVVNHSVLGVGLNVNQQEFPQWLPHAGSFSSATGKFYDLEDLTRSLCSFVESRYLQLKRGDLGGINQDYQSNLFLAGEWSSFNSAGGTFTGRILSVDDEGRLIIEMPDGNTRHFNMKEISFNI